MIYQHRVIFGDTDQMGIVYYANYYRYFEAGRSALLRAYGRSHTDMAEWGVALPVIESHCEYRSPAKFEDLLDIDLRVSDIRGATLRFSYKVVLGETLLCTGYTVHACVNPETGKARRIPVQLKELLSREPG